MGGDEKGATTKAIPTEKWDQTAPMEYNMEKLKLEMDIYRWVIKFLGVSILLVIIVVAILVGLGNTVPDGVIAIGSAAVGAMAGILAPSPAASK
jgi:hypothetical protein